MVETDPNLCPQTGEECGARARVVSLVEKIQQFEKDALQDSLHQMLIDERGSLDDSIMASIDARRAAAFAERATGFLEAEGNCTQVCAVANAAIEFALHPAKAPITPREAKNLAQV